MTMPTIRVRGSLSYLAIASSFALGCGGSVAATAPSQDAGSSLDAGPDPSLPDVRADPSVPTELGEAGGVADVSPQALADGAPPEADAGDVGTSCSVTLRGGAAKSAGYAGTSSAYFGLFDSVPCEAGSDCVPSCVGAGGSTSSCETGSLCLLDSCPDGGSSCLECLPPTYWLAVAGALGEPGSGAGGTAAYDVQAFDSGYNDTLEVTDFGIVLPAGAAVRGIAFEIDRQADDNQASDESVRLLKGGTAMGADRASSEIWPLTFTPIIYGGPADTWGAALTADDVAASDFGIALTPQFLSSNGSDRIEVDSVSVTVNYGGVAGCP